MLEIRNLHAYYGVIEALHGISIEMPDESIRCVIGSNGAGKTTLLKAISAVIRREGEIVWNGESILERTPQQLAQMGIRPRREAGTVRSRQDFPSCQSPHHRT